MAGACYHIWKMAESGNALFRWQRCFTSRATANSTVRNWVTQGHDRGGRRPTNIWLGDPGEFQVLECRAQSCPCACAREARRQQRLELATPPAPAPPEIDADADTAAAAAAA